MYNRDYGNYKLMIYLKTYGLKGSKKPTRNENGDLTFMLALIKNLKVLNMDDQQTNSEYHNAWRKCAESVAQNGDNDLNRKLNKIKIKSINMIKRHTKPTKENKSGIISKESFIHQSNVKNIDLKKTEKKEMSKK